MMAYQNNFVVSIIHNGKPVREFAENNQRTCVVPFGSEYKIRLKNKTNKRAKAKVFIDGMDTLTSGGYFILGPNQTLDLERFVDDLTEGKRFKFISLEQGIATGEIQDPTSQDNGVIRVEFYPEDDTYERFRKAMEELDKAQERARRVQPGHFGPSITWNSAKSSTNSGAVLTNSSSSLNGSLSDSTNVSYSADLSSSIKGLSAHVEPEAQLSTLGATVEGSQSKQVFAMSYDTFNTLAPTIISLNLRGPVIDSPQPTGLEVLFESGGVISVRMNGKPFVSSRDYGVKIALTDKGLSVSGKGIDIQTTDYKVVAS